MDSLQTIFTRRSIRKYSDIEIEQDKLNNILKAGMYAPSAVNRQPWEFIVVKDANTRGKIAQVNENARMLTDAKVGVVVCINKNEQHAEGYGIQDCSAAIQNMLLAAHAQGIGGVWLGIYPRTKRVKALAKLFNLPKHIQPLAVLSFGYPGAEPVQPDRWDENKVHYEKY